VRRADPSSRGVLPSVYVIVIRCNNNDWAEEARACFACVSLGLHAPSGVYGTITGQAMAVGKSDVMIPVWTAVSYCCDVIQQRFSSLIARCPNLDSSVVLTDTATKTFTDTLQL
jgi:hypothetical protein